MAADHPESVMSQRIVRANGVDLCVEPFGQHNDPAILLIHGASASMLGWEDEFCLQLAAGRRFVIRYDHRDTGRSVSYEPGSPPYSMNDLTEDAIGILDTLGIGRAHLVGRSMGGGLAMQAAIEHPTRVASLTLMATTAGGPDLSGPSAEFLEFVQGGHQPDWNDRDAVIDYVYSMLRIMDGGSHRIEELIPRDAVAADLDRTVNVASSLTNHYLLEFDKPIRPRLGQIQTPTLVIHGRNDPLFSMDHARAMSNEISGATLLVLPDCGHLILSPSWDRVVPAILHHTSHA
jgi:pimeloyl-ACP methyl ester carboxylesterase